MNTRFVYLLIAFATITAGCTSVPESTPELESARTAYREARSNADVLKYASGELEEAQNTLDRAAAAKSIEDMNSGAYVASTQVRTAIAKADREVAEAKITELSDVKNRVQLEVREAELEASRAQLAALKARKTERGTVVTLGSFLFETGKAVLLPGAMQSVARLGDYLENNPDKQVLIEGHTDSTGSDATNLRLSQERADSVRMALVSEGISPSRLVATGLGSSRPVASNDTAAGRQQNRRVEIIIQ